MQSSAQTVEEYLDSLPDDRQAAMRAVRELIVRNLPTGYAESMQFGMIGYGIPLSRYPDTYNKQPLCYAALASQKNFMTLYLMSVYGNPAVEQWFKEEYAKTGKKLDMGKSCLHFKNLEDLPLELIGETIASCPVEKMIEFYEEAQKGRKKGK